MYQVVLTPRARKWWSSLTTVAESLAACASISASAIGTSGIFSKYSPAFSASSYVISVTRAPALTQFLTAVLAAARPSLGPATLMNSATTIDGIRRDSSASFL